MDARSVSKRGRQQRRRASGPAGRAERAPVALAARACATVERRARSHHPSSAYLFFEVAGLGSFAVAGLHITQGQSPIVENGYE